MSRLRVNALGISIDGYSAGPDQAPDNPMGVGGMALQQWVFATKTFQEMTGDFAGSLIGGKVARKGVDDDFAARGFDNLGAWIMGRNMFAPSRGAWPDDGWKGWWGNNPPYHVPVFVLTHHSREPLPMLGGTTFNFVTTGIRAALEQARSATDKDIMIAGGAHAVQQFIAAGILDELYLHIAPIVLGRGERLLENVGDPILQPVTVIASPAVTHVKYRIVHS